MLENANPSCPSKALTLGKERHPNPTPTHPGCCGAVICVPYSESLEANSVGLFPASESLKLLVLALLFCPESSIRDRVGKGVSLCWPTVTLRKHHHPVYQWLIIDLKHMRVRKC